MDQDQPSAMKIADFAPPSRLSALSACRGAMGLGPVLLTGAPGVGKTSLANRLANEGDLAWVSADIAPGMTPIELWRSVLASLRIRNVPGSPRLVLAESLAERSADGVRIGLIVDEAHGASDEILEEIRLQSNRLGRPDGFAALVVCGQTPLARRLEGKKLEGLESRLGGRVHLLPLDERETRLWVEHRAKDRVFSNEEIEDLARESGGIPAKLDRLVTLRGSRGSKTLQPSVLPSEPEPDIEELSVAGPLPILPPKPPLRVEDGMIEVGWDAEPEISDEDEDDVEMAAEADHEPVDDHYAALQAWEEWVKNQGRKGTAAASPLDPADDENALLADEAEPEDDSPLAETPGVWAEGRQGFGPYSQLFSRTKSLKEAE